MTRNLQLALQLRDDGIARVAANNQEFLEAARLIAIQVAKQVGVVTVDMVRDRLELQPLHPNAFGAIFKDPRFEWTGHYVQSTYASRHGGMQRVWRLK